MKKAKKVERNFFSKTMLRRFFELFLGLFLVAAAFNLFFLKNDIVYGGVSGLSIITKHLFGWNPSNVKIIPVKVAVSKDFYTTDIIAAINYIAYYDKANVINMSYGGYAYSSAEYQAVAAANSKNIICVAAAGNDNIDSLHYPSSFDNTISVSSVDSKLEKSDF